MATAKKRKRKQYAKTKASKQNTTRHGILVFTGILLSLVVLFGVFQLLAYTGSLFFSRNSQFTLKQIDFRSDGILTASWLREFTELEPGVNLFNIDFDELREKLSTIPLVESVRLERKLPDTLIVDVTERVALAQVEWRWRAAPFLVDRNGVVMPSNAKGRSLPLIAGLKFDKLRPGDKIDDSGVLYALELLSLSNRLNSSIPIRFEHFELRDPDYITASVATGITVRFPRQSAQQKLIRLARVMELAREQGRRPKTVDLTPDGLNVPVTYY